MAGRMATIVVYDKGTRQVLAAIPLKESEPSIIHKGVGVRIFPEGTEPVFVDKGGVVSLKDNTYIVDLGHEEQL